MICLRSFTKALQRSGAPLYSGEAVRRSAPTQDRMPVATASFLTHSLRLGDFDFEYPRALVAAYPAEPREAAQ